MSNALTNFTKIKHTIYIQETSTVWYIQAFVKHLNDVLKYLTQEIFVC